MDGFNDRKMLVSLYAAAHQVKTNAVEPSFVRIGHLVESFDNPIRKVISDVENMSIASQLSYVIMALKPAIDAYLATETLRRNNMLNPTDEAGGLALPVRQPLSLQHPKQFLHSEMQDADQYMLWTVYVGIACPELLLREDRQFLTLFNTVSRQYLTVPVFRDQQLSVHQVNEELAKWFPPRNYKIRPPADLKNLKNLFKEEAKEATLLCGRAHAERRSYLRGEMANLVALFSDTPGLIAPKFPMVLTALAMAKAELLWYFAHKTTHTTKAVGKFLREDDYDDPYISSLIGLQVQFRSIPFRSVPFRSAAEFRSRVPPP
eukprot:scaffold7963_cov286-Pinguiococcus_pyrenoidosus.AAC.1